MNKFKNKYLSDKHPYLHQYIDDEVTKFLSNNRLTDENLLKLADKIGK